MAIAIHQHKYLVEVIKDFVGPAYVLTLFQDCVATDDCFKVVIPQFAINTNASFTSEDFPTTDKEGYKEVINEVRKQILNGERRGRRVHDENDFVRTANILLPELSKYQDLIGSTSRLDIMRNTLSMMLMGDIQSKFGPTCEK